MSHDQHHDAHGHGHHHDHQPPGNPSRAFAIGVLLNLAFVVICIVAGIAADSTALLADGAHNFGDVLGLAMAWGATILARRDRTTRRTYGFRRTTIVAALVNAMVILVAIGGVSWEAVERLSTPRAVDGGIVAIVAAIGVAINGLAAMMFAKGSESDLNLRGAFMHLVADAAVSAGVVVSGIVVWRTGWHWIDPVASIAVSLTIVIGTVRLLREATDLLLDAVPPHVDAEAVSTYLATLADVRDVHDLHIWSMSTTEIALTAHLVVPWAKWPPACLRETATELEHRFGIGHVTIQLDPDDQAEACRHTKDGAV